MKRAVFLDRDGVLNEAIVRDGKPYPPGNASELVICEGAFEALSSLRALGFVLVCVTNQPDQARGKIKADIIDEINECILSTLPLDAIFVCRHDDSDGCSCRKPKPGLLHQAAEKFGLNLDTSYLVGDRWRDIEAGATAKCRTILVDRHYDERSSSMPPTASVANLPEAALWIAKDLLR